MASAASRVVEPNKFKRDGKILVGKDDWLFLDNDTNMVVKQHTGDLLFSPAELRQWQVVLENRTAWVERLGGGYFFLIPPNPHTVYAEKMPDDLPLSPVRPVTQLLDRLSSSGSFARMLYPLDVMLEEKKSFGLYAPVDSHWNGRGAFVGYKRLIDDVEQRFPVRRVTDEEVGFVDKDMEGDLGHKADPPRTGRRTYAHVLRRSARLVADNCVEHTGRILVTECSEAPATNCVVCGDSFTYAMLPFLAESFRRVVFAQLATVDHGLVRSERAEVVITVVNERFLIEPPQDEGSYSATEWAADKIAKGENSMPDFGPIWGQDAPLVEVPAALAQAGGAAPT